MTRRGFLQGIIAIVLAVWAGCIVFARSLPKKVIWAKPAAKYPGQLKAMENIDSTSKWSG